MKLRNITSGSLAIVIPGGGRRADGSPECIDIRRDEVRTFSKAELDYPGVQAYVNQGVLAPVEDRPAAAAASAPKSNK